MPSPESPHRTYDLPPDAVEGTVAQPPDPGQSQASLPTVRADRDRTATNVPAVGPAPTVEIEYIDANYERTLTQPGPAARSPLTRLPDPADGGLLRTVTLPPASGSSHDGPSISALLPALPEAAGYKLITKLGTGTFGQVWEAENEESHERVAVKFFAQGDDTREKMLDEVRLMATVEGNGIIHVKEVRGGKDGRPPYYVMQLAPGGSLADAVKNGRLARTEIVKAGLPPLPGDGPLVPVRRAIDLFTRCAEALALCHRRGIYHCDLKPHNIMLTADGDPMIADFGQARHASRTESALGTLFYMPPDQAGRSLPDPRWDVYALAAVFYEMVAGIPPRKTPGLADKVKGTSHLETKLTVYRDGLAAAPRPTAHRPLVDKRLGSLIDRCLALDPNDRPENAGEVVAGLLARRKWQRTRPILIYGVVGTALALLLLVGLGGAFAAKTYADTQAHAKSEVQASLTRGGWYGGKVLEGQLQHYVGFVEHRAEEMPADLRAALADAGRRIRAADDRPFAGVPEADRQVYDDWMKGVHDRLVGRDGRDGGRPMALMTVADDRGFFLTRVAADGGVAPRSATDQVFTENWAGRDYFTGTGNHYTAPGQLDRRPRPVVRATQISHTYQSTADNKPWKMDIATPVWSGPNRTGEVVGLLILGLDVLPHIVTQIKVPVGLFDANQIAGRVQVVVVNDRDHWQWHDGAASKQAGADIARDPHRYDDLVSAARPAPVEAYRPWKTPDLPADGVAVHYTDLVPTGDGPADDSPEVAFVKPLRPYATSRYPAVQGRLWAFVVQVDEKVVAEPVERLRNRLTQAGLVGAAALLVLVAGVWVGLFRVLRAGEMASHG